MRRATIILIAIALSGCTGQQGTSLDKDADGAEDTVEVDGYEITIDFLDGPERRLVTSDPSEADTDGDGLLDGEELHVWGSDPRDPDTDDDRLLDGHDIPVDLAPAAEWRALGILELEGLFLGELDACPRTGQQLRPAAVSSDLPVRDELSDGEEIDGWDVTIRGDARRVTSDPCTPDTDSDGLRDHEERAARTDPRSADTDADGAADGVDADPLFDLALGFDNVTVEGADDKALRIVLTFGASTSEIAWPGNGSAVIDVNDQTGDRASLAANGVLEIVGADGRTLGGAILRADLVQGTISGANALEGDRLSILAQNMTLSLRWSVLRR